MFSATAAAFAIALPASPRVHVKLEEPRDSLAPVFRQDAGDQNADDLLALGKHS